MKNNSSAEEVETNENVYPSQKPCPIMEKARKKKNKNKRRKKLFEVTFKLCNDYDDIYPAYSKEEARKDFLKDKEFILDKEVKENISIKELSFKEFERKYVGKDN